MNWIFLDDQFNYISTLSGSVAAASSTYPAATLNTVAPGSAININRSGYLYIWVSNETQGWDVFFDNLSVQHRQGPLLEENHYYPFGLTMQGISDKALKPNYNENKYRYNQGTELQNKEFNDGSGWEIYETGFRSLDPQLGRFCQIDPLAGSFHFFSEYQFSVNNPIFFNDPSGALTAKQFTEAINAAYAIFANRQIYDASLTVNSSKDDISLSGSITYADDGGGIGSNVSVGDDGEPSFIPSNFTSYEGVFDKKLNLIAWAKDLPEATVTPSSDKPTAWDYGKDVLNGLGGLLELAAVVGSDGLLAPVLGVDGADRLISSIGRIAIRASTGSNKTADAMPTNLMGTFGALVFGIGSQQQQNLQNVNDILSLAAMGFVNPSAAGGMVGDLSNMITNLQQGDKAASAVSGLGVLNGAASLNDVYNQMATRH